MNSVLTNLIFWLYFFFAENNKLELQRRYTDPRIMRISFVLFWNRCHCFHWFSRCPQESRFWYLDRDPVDCAQKRGGGWWYDNGSTCAVWSNLNGIYPRCGSKTSADIYWAKLVPSSAEGSAPSSTEMKIRPVDFF